MRRGCGGLLAAALLLAVMGCTQNEGASRPIITPLATANPTPEATEPTPTSAPSPTPTEPEDPFAVPEVVNSDYVRRVLQQLRWIDDAGFRRIVEEGGELTEENLAFLYLIRTPENAASRRRLFQDDAEKGVMTSESREERGLTPLPEQTIVRSVRVLESAGDCFWVEAVEDLSASVVGSSRDLYQYYAIVPKEPDQDSEGVNPTPWAIAVEVRKPDGTRGDPPPESRCP